MAINTGAGASADYFGHADYDASIAAGYTPTQIFSYLQSNLDKLRGGNAPGGGGIFDIAKAKSNTYQQQQSQIADLRTSFESALQEQQRQMAAQQAAYLKSEEEMRRKMLQAQATQAAQTAAPQTAQVASVGKSMVIRPGASTRFNRPELQITSMNI